MLIAMLVARTLTNLNRTKVRQTLCLTQTSDRTHHRAGPGSYYTSVVEPDLEFLFFATAVHGTRLRDAVNSLGLKLP